ncbi:hypothetical protein MSG28_014900 [Choristoneura fumiferana]|uniref:Uncharacterized protein n=1 Tax=Choristoneura fumiferana TaxID=7141 RepID=A0ACC0KXI1_CHOFU|nr:hypothetical protein MSG28_014900 [Choristoneura fumiferana]
MEEHLNLQKDHKSRISKAYANFKKSPKDRLTTSYLETRLEDLERLWQQFTIDHQEILKSYDANSLQKTKYMSEDTYDSTGELYMEYKCELKEKLNNLTSVPSFINPIVSNSASSGLKSNQVKLPRITIPTFSGKYTEWMSFRELFVSLIHNNKEIDNVQKLHYLKANLTGEAEQRHHSLLHQKGELPPTNGGDSGEHPVHTQHVTNSMDDSTPSASVATHFVNKVTQQVLLATAVVEARSRERDERHLLRALIDQGSQASFITSAAVQLLGLKRTAAKGLISGLGGKQNVVSKSTVQVTITSRFDSRVIIKVTAYVLDKLTTYLPAVNVSIASWPELQGINLADPEYYTPNKIDMLLGAEVYAQIIDTGLIRCPPQGSPVAQNTTLGWILSGQVGSQPNISCTLVSMHTQVDQLLRSFWELESEPSNNPKILSPEEQRCEEIYHATTTRDKNGRYVVRLPLRDEEPLCLDGDSREIALRRFHSLERKLQRDQRLKTEYTRVFHEYRELEHMEQLSEKESEERGLYLPHHAVVRDDKDTTKVRIVFDASCRGTNGISLNDDLLVGPTLQADLRHIIMRWRMHPVCFIADIVKMYRQVIIDERDTKFQRVLWRDSPNENIQEYKLNRVTFGTSSAPYLAVKSLIQVAVDEGKDFPLAASRVRQDFYMDDLMSGCQSETEAIEVYYQMKALLSKGGFELQKWSSNSKAMLEGIKENNSGRDEHKKIEMKQEAVNKILGLTWDRDRDEFTYAVRLPPPTAPVTKRKVTSDIAKLYDPLGWIAPSIVQAKILIQRLWLSGIDWDEELPSPLLDEWLTYREELSKLTEFRLHRWTNHRSNATLVELHGFSDASNAAYAAVVYLRVIDAEGRVHVSLVTAKTRVAPIKQVSIPRLELCGAVLLSKLLVDVSDVLGVQKSHIHAWTDSEVVLAWLSSHPSRWKTFIGNRCSEILTATSRSQWAHVKSDHNPADCASRGVGAAELNNFELWLHGPTWLKKTVVTYPNPKSLITKLEERNIKTHLGTTAAGNDDEGESMWSKYSSLTKLLRVVAYCRRFLKNKRKNHTYLLKTELEEALAIMVKRSQIEAYGEEINDIKRGKLKRKSKLTSFTPQIDEEGIIRVGGRLQLANIDYDQKHPILLPKSCWLTQLVVRDAHCKTLHGGAPLMVNYIKAKFCIPGLKNLAKAHVKKCIPCVRHAANIRNQLMGQLPAPRVNQTKSFLHSGVDYAGPINMRLSKGRGNKAYKGYICLFVCMATRAVHIEPVSDLSTAGFLAAFKRFIGRRGHCSDLYSDNGSNFVGAAKELQHLFDVEKSSLVPEVADWMAINGTQWHFIPPHAPNFGGLWEAGIKSCKFHLKRVIGTSTLTYEEMDTVLTQIEACLNSRPMWHTNDNGEPLPLTPGHFLVGEPLIVAPDRCYEHVPISPLRRWQLCQRMLQDFWRRWSQDYLTQFLQQHKWTQKIPEPKVGDVVLVKEPDLPPARWLMGKVVKTHPATLFFFIFFTHIHRMFQMAEEFYTSMGLKPVPPEFWRGSMLVRPAQRSVQCTASAWDFCNRIDYRIKQCTEVTMQDLISTHHEMAHIQYYLQYADQPQLFRDGANPAFHEAVANAATLSVYNLPHLQRVGLYQNKSHDPYEVSINFLMTMALEKVAYLPFAFMVDQWRWSVFEDGVQNMNSRWWQMKLRYQASSRLPPPKLAHMMLLMIER